MLLVLDKTYPELYRIFGGSTPDYRGMFLRGVGGNSAGLGVFQNYEIQSHTHDIAYAFYEDGGGTFDGGSGVGLYLKTQPTGGIETRPMNKAVRYLIKAL